MERSEKSDESVRARDARLVLRYRLEATKRKIRRLIQ